MEIENGLPLYFGGVGGEHGGHGGVVQLLLQCFGIGAVLLQQRQYMGKRGFARHGIITFVGAAAALVVSVFGNIEHLRKQAASAD